MYSSSFLYLGTICVWNTRYTSKISSNCRQIGQGVRFNKYILANWCTAMQHEYNTGCSKMLMNCWKTFCSLWDKGNYMKWEISVSFVTVRSIYIFWKIQDIIVKALNDTKEQMAKYYLGRKCEKCENFPTFYFLRLPLALVQVTYRIQTFCINSNIL